MSSTDSKSNRAKKLLAFAAVALMLWALMMGRDTSWLDAAIEHESHLKLLVDHSPLFSVAVATVAYAALTAMPIPIASLGSLVAGWFLGFWLGLPAISIGATLGATITFLVMRFCFRDSLHSVAEKQLAHVNRSLQRDGVYYVAILRLIPGLPFFLVNALLAQTNLSLRAFVCASYLSMLPGTVLHLATGSAMPSLKRLRDEGIQSVIGWQLAGALLLLVSAPLLFRFVLKSVRKPDGANV